MPLPDLKQAKEVKCSEVQILQMYMSQEEKDVLAREKEYMEHGPGRVEAILNEEMGRLFANMEDKVKKQDEDFVSRVGTGGGKK